MNFDFNKKKSKERGVPLFYIRIKFCSFKSREKLYEDEKKVLDTRLLCRRTRTDDICSLDIIKLGILKSTLQR